MRIHGVQRDEGTLQRVSMLERGAWRTHARIEAGPSVQRTQAGTASQGTALPAREGRVISGGI